MNQPPQKLKPAPLRTYQGVSPTIAKGVYVDAAATVIGDTHIGVDSSVWPGAVIRGDMHCIRIGKRVSVQDNATLHITHRSDYNPEGHPLLVGDDVTIGHGVCLHGCTVGNEVLVGINSTVLDGAIIEDQVVIAAHSLVPPGKTLETGYLYMGSPVKKARPLEEAERAFFKYSANNYVKLKDNYLKATNESEPQT